MKKEWKKIMICKSSDSKESLALAGTHYWDFQKDVAIFCYCICNLLEFSIKLGLFITLKYYY